jgi:hypothetical protein
MVVLVLSAAVLVLVIEQLKDDGTSIEYECEYE